MCYVSTKYTSITWPVSTQGQTKIMGTIWKPLNPVQCKPNILIFCTVIEDTDRIFSILSCILVKNFQNPSVAKYNEVL